MSPDPALTAPLLAPFLAVARWVQRRLPPRARGLAVLRDEAALDALPARARVRLILPEARLLLREIELPPLPDERRPGWIAARLEEVSPWAAGAFHWAEIGPAGEGRLRVGLAAAEPLAALARRLEADGRHLAEVVAVRPEGPLWLVADQAGALRLAGRLRATWIAAMALGLGLAGWSWTGWQADTARADLAAARLERLVAEASSISGTAQAARQVLAAKTPADSLAAALDRLAAGLPLDSYLETLRLTRAEGGGGAEFQISGQSLAPEAMIPALQAAGGVQGADFAGALTRDAATGRFRFALTGQVQGSGAEAAP